MSKRIKSAVFFVIACVPFMAAPGVDVCPNCFRFWEDKLGIYADIVHDAEIEYGETYLVQLGLLEGTADLTIFGDVDSIDCVVDAGETECTFDAVADGEVSLKVSAGAEGAETFLNLDPM